MTRRLTGRIESDSRWPDPFEFTKAVAHSVTPVPEADLYTGNALFLKAQGIDPITIETHGVALTVAAARAFVIEHSGDINDWSWM